MPSSPFKDSVDVVSYEISINGQPVKDYIEILSIEVDRRFNQVGTAQLNIILPFGAGENLSFQLLDDESFEPGNSIQIALGSVDAKKVVFKGIITHTGVRNYNGQLNEWILQCSDEAVKMTLGCRSKSYANMKDNAVISAVAGEYGLSATVDSTQITHKQLVQYQCNDWDFILERAEANGLVAYTNGTDLMVKKPASSGQSVLSIDFENDVLEFEMGIDARNQLVSASCSGWDIQKLDTVKGDSEEPTLSSQGKLKGKDLGQKLQSNPAQFNSLAPLAQDELKAWANGLLLKSRLSCLQGTITCFGNASPELNKIVTLTGFGAHFNGSALVSSIRHEVRKGIWRTIVGFGMPATGYYERRPVNSPPAGGLLPSIQGLHSGVVMKISDDPDGLYRVQVNTPTILGGSDGIWARLAQFYATSGKGSYFYPEAGDEVLLGFINNDPRFPVILGMLYGSKNKPPYTPDEENKIKAIVTKNDLKIEFNDTDKVITISTPGGNQIVMSDSDKSIVVKDISGNQMEMSSTGIKLDSCKDIEISASKGKITLSAVQDISVSTSGGNLSLSGLNVEAKANIGFSAQGSASAELKSAGNTSVKGGIVMIN